MREIGGYIELDTYRLPMLHEEAIALNSGRNALACLFHARKIKKLWIPKLLCDSVTGVCEREGVAYSFYRIGHDLLPSQEVELEDGEWFYFVNYYSRFSNEKIVEYVRKYTRVIVDQAQSYFQPPLPGTDTLYTCRKYFGVADGAFLYTEASVEDGLQRDESFERMRFLLGRLERNASEFYGEYVSNNERFDSLPVRSMSKLTENLLHGIDYRLAKSVREANYSYLHQALRGINLLPLSEAPGTFMYPLFLENGAAVRKKLQEKKIYIPTLWPNVLCWCEEKEPEYQMANHILPLPIDQRYGEAEMEIIIKEIRACL